jgi:hypothetical protein
MYPDLSVSSYGIEADSRIPIPKSIRDIAFRWGYDLSGVTSKNTELITEVDSAESLFIFAEDKFSEIFQLGEGKWFGSYSFESLGLDRDLVAIDPVGLKFSNATSLEVEIAKAILGTSVAYHLNFTFEVEV